MSIRDKINKEFNLALKKQDKAMVSTLRLISAAVKDKDIASRGQNNQKGIKDDEIIQLLRKMIKQRKESAALYEKAGRKELLDVENQEISIINSFLPKQLGEEETKKICEETIKSLGASSVKDMGKIMGSLKKNYPDSIDFSKVNLIVKNLLN
tara:strand:- start:82 stop:540 length:459 start_codon:yes stop_codon:yes gene_type:complete